MFPKMGFVYPTKDAEKARQCLRSLRDHYPESRVVLVNYTNNEQCNEVAQEFNCEAMNVNQNFYDLRGSNKQEMVTKCLQYWNIMMGCVSYLTADVPPTITTYSKCDRLMIIDDTVKCLGQLAHIPNFDRISNGNVINFDLNTTEFLNKVNPGSYSYDVGSCNIYNCSSYLNYLKSVARNNAQLLKGVLNEVSMALLETGNKLDSFFFSLMGYTSGGCVEVTHNEPTYHKFTYSAKTSSETLSINENNNMREMAEKLKREMDQKQSYEHFKSLG